MLRHYMPDDLVNTSCEYLRMVEEVAANSNGPEVLSRPQRASPSAHDLRGMRSEKNGTSGMMKEDKEHHCCRDTRRH